MRPYEAYEVEAHLSTCRGAQGDFIIRGAESVPSLNRLRQNAGGDRNTERKASYASASLSNRRLDRKTGRRKDSSGSDPFKTRRVSQKKHQRRLDQVWSGRIQAENRPGEDRVDKAIAAIGAEIESPRIRWEVHG